jgi:hypothetical protein
MELGGVFGLVAGACTTTTTTTTTTSSSSSSSGGIARRCKQAGAGWEHPSSGGKQNGKRRRLGVAGSNLRQPVSPVSWRHAMRPSFPKC